MQLYTVPYLWCGRWFWTAHASLTGNTNNWSQMVTESNTIYSPNLQTYNSLQPLKLIRFFYPNMKFSAQTSTVHQSPNLGSKVERESICRLPHSELAFLEDNILVTQCLTEKNSPNLTLYLIINHTHFKRVFHKVQSQPSCNSITWEFVLNESS